MTATGPPGRDHQVDFRDVDAGEDDARATSVAILDLQAQDPAIRRLKTWVLEQLEPSPGMDAVDVGCGTGEDACALAVTVAPGGSAIGVDPSSTMLEEARRRASAAGNPARFVAGSAYDLPVGDSTVDLVRSERVLQHLADPVAAVREMARVLRPGGRVGLIDTDWRTLAIWPGDEVLDAATRDRWVASFATPAAGARLFDLVESAGFTAPRATAEVLLLRPRAVDQPPLAVFVAAVTASGDVSRPRVDAWLERLQAAAARGVLVASVTMHAVVATRPEEPFLLAATRMRR